MRCYYNEKISKFILEDENTILGKMNVNSSYDVGLTTKKSWLESISSLKNQLNGVEGQIIFEYIIPRIGKRIDVVLLIGNVIFLLEYKTNEREHKKSIDTQVMDYALDLKNFHKESWTHYIVPISVATEAEYRGNDLFIYKDKVFRVIRVNSSSIRLEINKVLNQLSSKDIINADEWVNSKYFPTPTIIESARYMYANHTVKDIAYSASTNENLTATTECVNQIVESCKKEKKKAICFITGVPGAGKTLAGLNIATQSCVNNKKDNAIFLSGNGPLVTVLQEALAQDLKARDNVSLNEARRNTVSFINNIHKFRDAYIENETPPFENIVVFDEAQRCWTKEQLAKFMNSKKNIPDFELSEPECLLDIMNRHEEWCVVICLVGGGQEINTGEAGIKEWIRAVREGFSNWNLFISDKLNENEYIENSSLRKLLNGLSYEFKPELHLATTLRSFKNEKLSLFIQNLLDGESSQAKKIYESITDYPIKITRNIERAKAWLKQQKRGSERIGILASSGALRLRTHGIWTKSKVDVAHWFLSEESHPESSNMLEQTCTEFDVQGLEVDYALVAWDGDFRRTNGEWKCCNFRGKRWDNIEKEERKKYKTNAYRVLLTRARQGMVIFVPYGVEDDVDSTRCFEVYDETYNYLLACGVESIDE